MSIDLLHTTTGVRRFVEFALSNGHQSHSIGLTERNKDIQPTTLVYRTEKMHLIVYNATHQTIPRSVTGHLIGSRNLADAYRRGEESIREEMVAGRMSPFVSEKMEDFTVWLDYLTFRGNSHLAFYLGNEGNAGFSLPAKTFRELLTGLYGEERVRILYLFRNIPD